MSAATFDTVTMYDMMRHALEASASKTGMADREQVMQAIAGGNCAVCAYLRHALAKEMAAYLGSVDGSVKAVYTYEPEYATSTDGFLPGQPTQPAINMIAWVDNRTAALTSVADILTSALRDELKSLDCSRANALCQSFDLKIVDDEDVTRRSGYGALVNSIYVRPLELWHR